MLDEGKVAVFEGWDIVIFDFVVMWIFLRFKGILVNLCK